MITPQLQSLLETFGVRDGVRIDFRRYNTLLTTVNRWYGAETGAFLMDCFIPDGSAVEPGYEDSCEYYWYEAPQPHEIEEALLSANG